MRRTESMLFVFINIHYQSPHTRILSISSFNCTRTLQSNISLTRDDSTQFSLKMEPTRCRTPRCSYATLTPESLTLKKTLSVPSSKSTLTSESSTLKKTPSVSSGKSVRWAGEQPPSHERQQQHYAPLVEYAIREDAYDPEEDESTLALEEQLRATVRQLLVKYEKLPEVDLSHLEQYRHRVRIAFSKHRTNQVVEKYLRLDKEKPLFPREESERMWECQRQSQVQSLRESQRQSQIQSQKGQKQGQKQQRVKDGDGLAVVDDVVHVWDCHCRKVKKK